MQEKKPKPNLLKLALFTVFSVLFADQFLKIWIKTNMHLGEEIHVAGNWFIIHFTENNGMAFGLELAGEFGKLFLSVFRIFAAAAIAFYGYKLIKSNASARLIIFISLIFAGAVGNILDSAFYGVLFSESDFRVAEFLPGNGYSSFLHGKVVDMFYFPVLEGNFPSWIPIWGGEDFIFFRPVFNIADSAITIGVIFIILFQSHIFHDQKKETPADQILEQKSNDPAITNSGTQAS